MAGELSVIHTTAKTVYAVLVSPHGPNGGQLWNTATGWEAFATWTDYDIVLAEITGAGIYIGNMPNIGGQEWVDVIYFEQAGGSPAVTDAKIETARFHRLAGGLWLPAESVGAQHP